MIGRDSLYRLQTRRTSAQDGVLQNFSEREAASAPFARSTASMQGPRPCRFSSLQLNGRDFLRRCDVSCLNFAQFAQQAGNLRWQPLYRCKAVPSQNLILATPDGAYELELRTLRKTTHLQGRSATSFRRRYIFGRPAAPHRRPRAVSWTTTHRVLPPSTCLSCLRQLSGCYSDAHPNVETPISRLFSSGVGGIENPSQGDCGKKK